MTENYKEVHLSEIYSCINCQYFHEKFGECRVDGPMIDQKHGATIWPLVAKKDWCGKFVLESKVLRKVKKGVKK